MITVSDGRGGSDTQIVHLEVMKTAADTAPTVTFSPPEPATAGRPYEYQIAADDADGDALTYKLDWGPAGMAVDGSTGLLTWTPPAGAAGQDFSVQVSVADSRGARTASQVVNLSVQADIANQPPMITSTHPDGSAAVDYKYVYQVTATDPDGDAVAYSLTASPKGMTIDATTGLLTWTPDSTFAGARPRR